MDRTVECEKNSTCVRYIKKIIFRFDKQPFALLLSIFRLIVKN